MGRRFTATRWFFCRIDGNPVKPGIKRTVATKVRQRPIRFEEGLLRDIQSFVVVFDIARYQIHDLVLVFVNEYIERRFVARLYPLNQ